MSIVISPDNNETVPVDSQALEAELATIKMRGIAFSFGERVKGVNGASAPVFSDSGRVLGAITIAGPTTRLHLKVLQNYAHSLKEEAERISKELGHHPGKPAISRRVQARYY